MAAATAAVAAGDTDIDKVFRDQLVALLPSLRAFARGLCRHREMADDLRDQENDKDGFYQDRSAQPGVAEHVEQLETVGKPPGGGPQ